MAIYNEDETDAECIIPRGKYFSELSEAAKKVAIANHYKEISKDTYFTAGTSIAMFLDDNLYEFEDNGEDY
jgi:hypothetical protein